MRAMILTAGLGTRLRPLTLTLPKPLAPVVHRPLVGYLLHALKDAGVDQALLNLHHLPGAFPLVLGEGEDYGVRLSWQYEPTILGTGGGVRQAAEFLGEGPCLLLNGDFLIEVDLKSVVALHQQARAADPDVVATMVLREDPAAARYGALGVDQDGFIVDFVGRARVPGREVVRRGLFTGIHVLEKELRDALPGEGEVDINRTAYPALIAAGKKVRAHFQSGHWSDIGTLGGLLQANLDVLGDKVHMPGPDPREEAGLLFVAEGETRDFDGIEVIGPASISLSTICDREVTIGPWAVIGHETRLGAGTRVQRAVVMSGARLDGEVLDGALVWRAPQGTLIERTQPTVGDPGR